MPSNMRQMTSFKRSCDHFAPKINRFGVRFPHGVLKLGTFFIPGPVGAGGNSASRLTWRRRHNHAQSSSKIPWVVLCLSMYRLGTLSFTLALIMCGSG